MSNVAAILDSYSEGVGEDEAELENDEEATDSFDVSKIPQHLVQRFTPEARRALGVPLQEAASVVLAKPETTKPWRSSVQFVAQEAEDIEWVITGVLPTGAVVLMSGREGSMKSFLALSMARAVASGEPWLGKPTKQGAVLYLDGEMPPGVLRDRLQGIGPVEPLHVWNWTDSTFPQRLDNVDLREAAKSHSLIVVDTLRRHMKGLKENSSDDMAVITDALRELTRHGATVLVLHHAPKDSEKQDYRGSTELGAGVDITISLTKEKSKEGITLNLETRKTRYSSSGDLEIEVTKGDRTPLFTVNSPGPAPEGKAFVGLCMVMNDSRERLGRNPNQSEVIAEAKKRGLGGKSKILGMLKERDGAYWRSEHKGNQVTYAPVEDADT
jgi:archaellum biogenesis ATPase FlaH